MAGGIPCIHMDRRSRSHTTAIVRSEATAHIADDRSRTGPPLQDVRPLPQRARVGNAEIDPAEADRACVQRRFELVGHQAAVDPFGQTAGWYFRLSGTVVRWSWRKNGRPPVSQLQPIRKPQSSARSRHIPVTAFSTTNRDHVHLESGLEHDLVRRCDRDPDIKRIVPQPFRLVWNTSTLADHFPDLMTVHASGSVTVWDARSTDNQDQDFLKTAAATREACRAAGWGYEVFSGLSDIERLNLLWLHGFRRPPAWLDGYIEQIRDAARSQQATIGGVLIHDDGSGELKSVAWHLMWRGVLTIDLGYPITGHTSIRWNDDAWGN